MPLYPGMRMMNNPMTALAAAADAMTDSSRLFHYLSVAWTLTNAAVWVVVGVSTVSFTLANQGLSTISEAMAPIRVSNDPNPPQL